jgi:2-keto-4-pentenoate hydratase/2-oxohepta-3-ene-1,7-dioic acid hydratase in catechol pathway
MLRFVRYQRDLQIGFGLLEQEGVVPLTGRIYNGWQVAGEAVSQSQVTLLAPCTPTKIIGAGLNYRSVAEAKGKELTAEPILFLKPPSAVIGPGAPIVYPSMVSQLSFEAEIAVVISRRCHRVDPGGLQRGHWPVGQHGCC